MVIGFTDTCYTVREDEGTVTVTAEILQGTVADEKITLQFYNRNGTAMSMFFFLILQLS